ncbi:cytochrome P450 [Actinoallomurus sp. CA-150999]|uniref:cytochrome P450 n=1 Tax=Actinoallomurus sp. CA-150999 TaxID=3239887 RepID=UPI003D8D6C70
MTDQGEAGVQQPLSIERLPVSEDRDTAYAKIRERGPVTEITTGTAAISRETVEYVLRHPELFSSKRAYDSAGSPVPMLPIAFDPPEHTRYRRLLQPHFSPRRIRAMEPEIRALAVRLVGDVAEAGRCDFVSSIAVPLPAQVFQTMFGLPLADRDRLIAWKDAILSSSPEFGAEAPSEAAGRAARELSGYLVEHIAARRVESGGTDLLAVLLADTGDDRLTEHELLGMCFQFVLAGLDTVTDALSNAFAILATRPDLRQQLVDDPGIIPDAIEELLRIDGPILTLPRVAVEDVQLDGHRVTAGSAVHVAVAVADRDPSKHSEPDTIDFHRRQPHLAFGIGPHFCLGAHLARLEMKVVLEEWHRRIPGYQLADGVRPAALWPAGLVGVASLPLVYPVEPRASRPTR